jgi:hypothetical protein
MVIKHGGHPYLIVFWGISLSYQRLPLATTPVLFNPPISAHIETAQMKDRRAEMGGNPKGGGYRERIMMNFTALISFMVSISLNNNNSFVFDLDKSGKAHTIHKIFTSEKNLIMSSFTILLGLLLAVLILIERHTFAWADVVKENSK